MNRNKITEKQTIEILSNIVEFEKVGKKDGTN